MSKYILHIIFLICICNKVYSQDTYYSNPFAASLYLNPAQTGLISGKTEKSYPKNIRVGMVNRVQWIKSGTPFESHYIEFHALRKSTTNFMSFGYGFFANSNKQGVMTLRNTQLSASGSAIFNPNFKNENHGLNISLGINLGSLFTNINPDELKLNDQILSGAAVSRDLIGYSFANNYVLDISAGCHFDYSIKPSTKNNWFFSFGYTNAHFTRENISFLNENYNLLERSNIYLKANYLRSKNTHYPKIRIGGHLLFQGQSNFSQNEWGVTISPTLYLLGVSSRKAAKNFIDFCYSNRGAFYSINQEIIQVNFHILRLGISNIQTGFSAGFSTDLAFGSNPLENAYTLGTQEIYLKINMRDRMDLNRKRRQRIRNFKEPSCPNWQ